MDLLLLNNFALFLIVLSRISGIFITAPVFGSKNIPIYTKVLTSLLFALVIFPLIKNVSFQLSSNLLSYIIIIVAEILIGIIIGFAASLIFSATQMAGQLIDMQIGLGIVNIFDPQSGQQVPLLGNFNYILALVVFLSINGHHVLIQAIYATFKIIPISKAVFSTNIPLQFIDLVGNIIVIAVKISMPILIAILLADVALGILAKTMPQMNIFVVGIPSKIIIGLIVLILSMPVFVFALEGWFNEMFRDIFRLLSDFRPTI